MKMKHTIWMTMVMVAVALTSCGENSSASADMQKPNIVYFLVDDMGFSDCGFNGGKEILTPEIDQLAKQGVVFENYYVQPVCSTSRACLMTGRYPIRTGIYGALKNDSQYGLPLNERLLPQALQSAGYTTAICGKWHLGEFESGYVPMQRGFDHQYGLWLGMIDYNTHVAADGHGRRMDWFRDDKPCDEEGYATHLIAKEAVRIIQQQPKNKPLFLYIPFNAVHGPWMVPDKYSKPYKKLPPNRRTVAGMLAVVDEAVGQVVDALKARGMDRNTLIVFSSDNGGARPGDRTSNTPLRDGKGSIYEGGVRSAAFAVFPGKIPAGQKVSPALHLIDWYPTLVTLAGGDLSQPLPLDGQDIWPLLIEGHPPERDAILLAGSPQRYAIRMGDWKLLVMKSEDGKSETVELYNLENDISETKNCADSQPERVRIMKARLSKIMEDAVPDLRIIHQKEKGSAHEEGCREEK
jgi:arylsulfatase A-like enzyme